jgi:hypothetical protein
VSDQDQNLRVLTEHIIRLAEKQQTAADKVLGANRMTGDVASRVTSTHGLVCSATSLAVSGADTARKAAGEALHKVSTELSEKLTTAANNYNNADYRAGRSLGQACQM